MHVYIYDSVEAKIMCFIGKKLWLLTNASTVEIYFTQVSIVCINVCLICQKELKIIGWSVQNILGCRSDINLHKPSML